jgi:hypothetical protein
MAVQGNIARLTTRDHELSQPLLCHAPDKWMILKDLYSLDDEIHCLQRSRWIGLQQKIDEPTEIRERSLGIDYARQALAFGFEADSP